MSDSARILPGSSVLPPMPRREPPIPKAGRDKANGRLVGQRFRVLNTFIDFTMRELDRAGVAVWLVLYRDSKDGIARTSQADMARRAGLSERHVRRVLARLARAGLLVLVRRGNLRSGPSSYRVVALATEQTQRT